MGAQGLRSLLPRRAVWASAIAVTFSLLMVSVAGNSVAAAAASGAPAAQNPSTTWAYGALKQLRGSANAGSTGPTEVSYSVTGTFGFAIVLTETKVGSSVYFVNVSRVMGSILKINYCRPTCASAVATGSITHRAWESLNASLELVSNGSVVNNTGAHVQALAIKSSAIELSAGLRDSAIYTITGTLQRGHNLSANLSAHDALMFLPPLGLFPLNITRGESWTSSSSFQQAGAYSWSLSNRVWGALVSPLARNYTRNGSGAFNSSGNVTLHGGDSGHALDLGGSLYHALNLSVTQGAFVLREGILLVPRAADLFGSAKQAWLTNQTGFANATQVNVDVGGQVLGPAHLALGGSGEWWSSRSINPVSTRSSPLLSPALSVTPAVSGSNATYVQGAPESPAQATSDQHCLLTGLGCPTGATTPFRGTFGIVVLVGAVVVVGAFGSALVIGQRRRMPPPVFPNASLYPPGQSTSPRGTAADGPTSSPPADEEEDPLGHLW